MATTCQPVVIICSGKSATLVSPVVAWRGMPVRWVRTSDTGKNRLVFTCERFLSAADFSVEGLEVHGLENCLRDSPQARTHPKSTAQSNINRIRALSPELSPWIAERSSEICR